MVEHAGGPDDTASVDGSVWDIASFEKRRLTSASDAGTWPEHRGSLADGLSAFGGIAAPYHAAILPGGVTARAAFRLIHSGQGRFDLHQRS